MFYYKLKLRPNKVMCSYTFHNAGIFFNVRYLYIFLDKYRRKCNKLGFEHMSAQLTGFSNSSRFHFLLQLFRQGQIRPMTLHFN